MVDKVRDIPADAEMISNSQEIRSYLKDFAPPCVEEDYVGGLFVHFDGGYGDIAAIWLCEDQYPSQNDNVWEIYPSNDYCS